MTMQPPSDSRTKPTVLVLHGWYSPGFKAGGSLKSIMGIVSQLSEEFDFRILTRDRDLGDASPYPNVTVDAWQRVGKADVFYLSPGRQTWSGLRRMIKSTDYDVLYLNSVFSVTFSIIPLVLRRFRLIKQKPVVLASRGELTPGAIRLKYLKKKTFLWVAKMLGLHRNVVWQASNELERNDIQQWFNRATNDDGVHGCVRLAQNLSPDCASDKNNNQHRLSKAPGSLNAIFLSRISPKKNLDYALNVLQTLKGKICFDIYGPVEDRKYADYWANCQRLIAEMPDSVEVNYKGAIEMAQVAETFAQYDVFFFPTRGENFGHVIVESLAAGCPVLLSDQTPWRDLEEKQAGWDIPLDQPDRFRDVLEQLVRMDGTELGLLSRGARELASRTSNSENALAQNRQLFSYAASRGA